MPVPGFNVDVTDLETNQIFSFNSIRNAAKYMGYGISSVLRWEAKYKKTSKEVKSAFKGRFYIKINRYVD